MNVTTIEVEFAKRTEEQIKAKMATSHADVPKAKCTLDFGKLTEEEILQWAQRGVVISVQSKLDSGALKLEDLAGKVYEVPKPGDRKRKSDTDKVRELVAKLLGKEPKDLTDEEVMQTLAKALGK